jgi:hypothetical protein
MLAFVEESAEPIEPADVRALSLTSPPRVYSRRRLPCRPPLIPLNPRRSTIPGRFPATGPALMIVLACGCGVPVRGSGEFGRRMDPTPEDRRPVCCGDSHEGTSLIRSSAARLGDVRQRGGIRRSARPNTSTRPTDAVREGMGKHAALAPTH